jgi:trk system potassium uptake protein TrkH
MTLIEKIGNSFFQSVTSRTAGFNTIDIEHMNPMTRLGTIMLMFIGVAPGSTGEE